MLSLLFREVFALHIQFFSTLGMFLVLAQHSLSTTYIPNFSRCTQIHIFTILSLCMCVCVCACVCMCVYLYVEVDKGVLVTPYKSVYSQFQASQHLSLNTAQVLTSTNALKYLSTSSGTNWISLWICTEIWVSFEFVECNNVSAFFWDSTELVLS